MIPALRAAGLLLVVCILAVACGPAGPAEEGGEGIDPVETLTILPSPERLRGEPAAAADEATVQEALTGAPDPALADVLRGRGMRAAAVRSWSDPEGGRLVAVVSVWESHLVATGVGGQAAELLLERPGARAWTPGGLGGARGARLDAPGGGELRVAFAVGPNSIYVRAAGPVDASIVERAAGRLIQHAQAVG